MESAVDAGNVFALENLARWFAKSEEGYAPDEAKSRSYYLRYEKTMKKLFDRGSQGALLIIAGIYHYSDDMKDEHKALDIYTLAIERGIYEAYDRIGSLYFWDNKKGLPYDRALALEWYAKYTDATGECVYFPTYQAQKLNPKSDILGDPRKAAECVLRSQVRYGWELSSDGLSDYRKIAGPTRIEIQRILSEAGYYKGEIDGAFGPATEKALNNYLASF